jgi:hypothetical protein
MLLMHACVHASNELAVPAGLCGKQRVDNIYTVGSRTPSMLMPWLQTELDVLGEGWRFSSEMLTQTDPRPYTDDTNVVRSGRLFVYTIFERLSEACYARELACYERDLKVRCFGGMWYMI